jgi:hypothetical protein
MHERSLVAMATGQQAPQAHMPSRPGDDTLWPCLDTLAGLELELVSNSSSSPKLTLALEVFG